MAGGHGRGGMGGRQRWATGDFGVGFKLFADDDSPGRPTVSWRRGALPLSAYELQRLSITARESCPLQSTGLEKGRHRGDTCGGGRRT